ncbi:hypothetical protein T265_03530 [Opisthorchis viverrini]|uniref:CWH43-like N-terminal domain-containing protein n=1 Tax=Opisthorchis viverrini TaxID=6198 RepID=A0A074ZVM3_OPIVI|nr:hypothetical protein T265_03530 [Opisthorchis viverrini]KER29942.1 hypothetical protein T265_03530 [Opisthorchis viverrini]
MSLFFFSDTGTWVPESCIFGQLLNMAATLSRTAALPGSRRAVPAGPEHKLVRMFIRCQSKVRMRANPRKTEKMEEVHKARNALRLFHLTRISTRWKRPGSETIKDRSSVTIVNRGRPDRSAENFEQQCTWPSAVIHPEPTVEVQSWTMNLEFPAAAKVDGCICSLNLSQVLGSDGLPTLFNDKDGVLSAVSAYLWYKQANARLLVGLRPLMRCRCRTALGFGLLSSLGISLVANFQSALALNRQSNPFSCLLPQFQETAVWAVHLTGAALLYCCGLVYFAIVTNVSHHYLDSKQWALRVVLCTCATISAFILPVAGTVARFMYDGKNIRKWTPEDRGYVYHAISSFAEWMLAICCLGFSLTMVAELKDYSILAVKLKHHRTRHSRDSTLTLTE